MDPSSFHSQFMGFKAVIGNGEQSLKVDLEKKVHQDPGNQINEIKEDENTCSRRSWLRQWHWTPPCRRLNSEWKLFNFWTIYVIFEQLILILISWPEKICLQHSCSAYRACHLSEWRPVEIFSLSLNFIVQHASKVYLVWLFICLLH